MVTPSGLPRASRAEAIARTRLELSYSAMNFGWYNLKIAPIFAHTKARSSRRVGDDATESSCISQTLGTPGVVAEWFKAAVLKTADRVTGP